MADMPPNPTSPETPWPVRVVNEKVKGWIERLGTLWVEGQLAQVSVKPTWQMAYLVLRDPESESSVKLTCPRKLAAELQPGDRVVVHGKPAYYAKRGEFSLWVTEIRHVGIGELLARIEQLRQQLAREGLFERKRPLPFLPRRIGLITSRASAAERDVMSIAQARWSAVQFEVINTLVQGPKAVPEIIDALQQLDANPEVDVIIIARGGGSVEGLLPFSEEALQRAVAACGTPVVSAIGHEPDSPILDNVADLRAATPTDAAKKVVPDVAQELALLSELRTRAAAALRGWVQREERNLTAIRSRPVLSRPLTLVEQHELEVSRAREALSRDISRRIDVATAETAALRARVAALGPAATLARGYSVVQVVPRDGSGPQVVTTIDQAPPGSQLRIRVADGSITAAGMSTTPAD